MNSLKAGQTIKLKRQGNDKWRKATTKTITFAGSPYTNIIEFKGIKGAFTVSHSDDGSYQIFTRYPKAVAHPLRRLTYHEVI
jgi:hypothetical protein